MDTMSAVADACYTHSPVYIFTTYTLIASSVIFAIIILLLVILLPPNQNKQYPPPKSHHVVITGGSSGIGLSIAKQCALLPQCNRITLIARNENNLKKAAAEISSINPSLTVTIHPTDVSNWDSISSTAKKITSSPNSNNNDATTTLLPPPPTLLFNIAGTSTASRFVETPPSQFSHLMNVNYLGTVYTTRAFLPHMPPGSTVVMTSSAAGQVGVYGYTAYSPTKFALRGFAEALSMEVCGGGGEEKGGGIWVQLAFPPDTDTPGFEAENVGKPEETRLISEEAGLFDADLIAKKMVKEALARKKFLVYFSLDTWMLSTLTSGMSGVHNIFDAICQTCLMSLLRLVSLFYLSSWRRIVERCRNERASKTEGEGVNVVKGAKMD